MAKYTHCPKCGNSEHGRPIVICNDCSTTYCTACAKKSGLVFVDNLCPSCKSIKKRKIGNVINK